MCLRYFVITVLIAAINLAPARARALVIVDEIEGFGVKDIEVVDGFAYVVSRKGLNRENPTLRILDVSNPTSPVEVGSFDNSVGAGDVEVVGGLAYITDHGYGSLRIIDVSDPTAPIEIGAFAAEFAPIDVEVVGELAFLADQLRLPGSPCCGSALRVIDVSNPAAPVEVSALPQTFIFDIGASEGIVYVASFDLKVIDVSNPSAPGG